MKHGKLLHHNKHAPSCKAKEIQHKGWKTLWPEDVWFMWSHHILGSGVTKRSVMYAGPFYTPLYINHHSGYIPESTRGGTRVIIMQTWMKHVPNVSTARSNPKMERALPVQHLANKMPWKGSCSFLTDKCFFYILKKKLTTCVQKKRGKVKIKG